jgi:hypothetical protein
VVVSTAVAPGPRHKHNPGTQRERATRAKAHAQHRRPKQGRQTPPPRATAQREAPTWGLGTTAPTVTQAVGEEAGRMSIEEPSRDWQHHGAVRAAVAGLPTETMGARLSGVVGLASTVQRPLGQRVRVEPRSQQRRAPWTGTDRGSGVWGGQRLFDEPAYAWSGWLAQQWESLEPLMAAAPATPVPEPALAEAA